MCENHVNAKYSIFDIAEYARYDGERQVYTTSVIIAVCACYCDLLESAVWPSTADFSSLGFL